MARQDIINPDGSLNYDTIGGFKERLDAIDRTLSKRKTIILDLAKYGIITTPKGQDLTPTTPNYRIAYANGVGIQNAINDAKAAGASELVIPPGNYPLCYAATSYDQSNRIIDAVGMNLTGYGARLYVLYDDWDTGLNPYYTGDVTLAHALCGGILYTDSNVEGLELQGERGSRNHPNDKYRDTSFGIGLTTGSSGNLIKNCKIHRFSGDGIFGQVALPGAYISNTMNCAPGDMVNGVPTSSTKGWISGRMGIGYSVDPTKPIIVCQTGFVYFIWTSRPMKICCFDKNQTWIADVRASQGTPFTVPENTFYVYVVTYSGADDNTGTFNNLVFRFGNGVFYNTHFEDCDIFANTRGAISNPPSDAVIKNCRIHDNGGYYLGMAGYYDGTQFGIDVEDWYVNRITIDSCQFYGNLNDIIHRCNDIIIRNTTCHGYVNSLNYAVNILVEHSYFYGGFTLNSSASFGLKHAVGCYVTGKWPAEMEVFSNQNLPTQTVMESTTGMVSFLNSKGNLLFTMDLSKFKPETITPYVTKDLLLDTDFTGRTSAGAVTFDDGTGKATVTTYAGACVDGGLSVVAAGQNMATVNWKATQTFNQEITLEQFSVNYPQHTALTSGLRDILGSSYGYGVYNNPAGTFNGNEFLNPVQLSLPYTNTSNATAYPTGSSGNQVWHDDGTSSTASQNGTPGINVVKYQHIVMILKANGTVQVYINGYLNTTASTTTAFKSWDYSTMSTLLYLWRDSALQTYAPLLKSFRIYNRALSQSEIRYNRDYGIQQYGITLLP